MASKRLEANSLKPGRTDSVVNNKAKQTKVKRAVKNRRNLSLRRLLAYVGLCLGGVVLVVGVLILMFGDAILNGYGKGKAERTFAEAHPGSALRLGALHYAPGANRLVIESVILSTTNTT